jgi:very-short-patch-repair endonuclease
MRTQHASRSEDEAIARLATTQSGVVAHAQLRTMGVSADQIKRRIAAGRLRPLHRGVYAVGHDALPTRGRLVAALLVSGPHAALSHGTAAALWKLIPSMPQLLEVTTAKRAPARRPGLRFYATAAALDTRTRHGLRITAPVPTLLGLAATRPAPELADAVSEALFQRLVSLEALTNQHGRGAARLRALAADAAPTRSPLQRALLQIPGVPRPEVEARIGPYRVDLLWRAERVVVETDGWQGHGHRLAFERDRARDAALLVKGYAVLRFTWRQVRDEPARVAGQIAGVLSGRAARTAP